MFFRLGFFKKEFILHWCSSSQSYCLKWNFKGALSSLKQFLAIESPLKMKKNAFYLTSKALFVLKIFEFSPWLFSHVAKQLAKKDRVSFKFYDIRESGKQTILIYILPNILRSKGNQTMKLLFIYFSSALQK